MKAPKSGNSPLIGVAHKIPKNAVLSGGGHADTVAWHSHAIECHYFKAQNPAGGQHQLS